MNLNLDRSSAYGGHRIKRSHGLNSSLLQKRQNNKGENIHFTADFSKIVTKAQTTYSNFDGIAESIDKILGNNFFTETLSKAGLIPEKNSLVIQNSKLHSEIFKTLKYPFVDMPFDLANAFLKTIKKIKPLEGVATEALKFKPLSVRADKILKEKNYNLALEILDGFTNKKLGTSAKIDGKTTFNIERCAEYFKEKAAEGVTKSATSYSARDERTLNRLITGLVSAGFGGKDFYNISMLQKDDKNEADKAGKSRFKQEASRMAMSGGITFFTLGALNKYIKNSLPLNIIVIAASALITETVSRIIHHTPLIALTPEQAAKIAESKNKENNTKYNDKNAKQLPLKGIHTNKEKQVFGKFSSSSGSIKALDVMNNDSAQRNTESNTAAKKTIPLKNILFTGFGAASAAYIIGSFLKGEFAFNNKIKSIYDKHSEEINKYIKNQVSGSGIQQILKDVNVVKEDFAKQKSKFGLFDKLKDLITKKKIDIDLKKLEKNLDYMSSLKEGEQIKDLIDKYKAEIQGKESFTYKIDKKLVTGLYNGISKIFKTVYEVLSLPGMAAKNIFNKVFYGDSIEAFNKIQAINYKGNAKKELAELSFIINKALEKNPNDEGYKKAIEIINKNVRNFSDNPETGELANYARTCVTVISSIFFVNDYRNRVLIESGGKGVQKAEEEKNERLAHKLANFVVNGTLMNLFNSVFKVPLNKSLFFASVIPFATEYTNEILVRKLINQPTRKMGSRQEIIDYEKQQYSRKGIAGFWSKTYRKLTGKKSLTEKAGIDINKNA